MTREEKAKERMVCVCQFIKEHDTLPTKRTNIKLRNDFCNFKCGLKKKNTTVFYDSLHDIIKKYECERWFYSDVTEIVKERTIQRLQEEINTSKRIPTKEAIKKYKDRLSFPATNNVELAGLERLNVIIDFVLKHGIEPKEKDKPFFSSLMSFKMAKKGIKTNCTHYESYDKLCVERGVPDLLLIKKATNPFPFCSTTPTKEYISKVEKNGLIRLDKVITYVLEHRSIPRENDLYRILSTFRSAKKGKVNLVFFPSYDKLCVERGVPDLLV